jgi:NADH-quinone oxidoreductase subunit C
MYDKLKDFLQDRFADAILGEDSFRDQISYRIRPAALLDICQALQEDPELDVAMLSDVTCVDWLGHERERDGRFEVVFNLYSLSARFRFFLTVRLPADKPAIQSLTPLYASANWLEREVFDLFGIEFEGHPDLTKIVTPDELVGHPLRKDFPLTYEQPQFSYNKDDPPEVIK